MSRRRLPVLADVALAAAAGAVDVYIYSDASTPRSLAAVIGFVAIAFVVLLARRRHPVLVFAVVWVHALLAAPVTGTDFRPTAGPALAMFTVAAQCSTVTSVVALLAWEVVAVVSALREANSRPPGAWLNAFLSTGLYNVLIYAAVWAAGRGVRASRLHEADLEFRREVEAEQAVATERTRIARELHDIVSHAVTVMVLQAAGARRSLARDRAAVDRCLRHIETVGEQAMGELRRMLTALRPTGDAQAGPIEAPALSEAGLRDLVESVTATGVRVELRVTGQPRPLSPSVGLAGYRVVQEALTNVTKHAGAGATAQVRITWIDDRVEVSVCDDGQGSRPHGRQLSAEHGLRGLRERLAIVGGQLVAGDRDGGGFSVVAWLPVTVVDRTEAPL